MFVYVNFKITKNEVYTPKLHIHFCDTYVLKRVFNNKFQICYQATLPNHIFFIFIFLDHKKMIQTDVIFGLQIM